MSEIKFITTRDYPNSLVICQVRYCNGATNRLLNAAGQTEAEAKDRAVEMLRALARDLQQWLLLSNQSKEAVAQPVCMTCPAAVPTPESPQPPDSEVVP